MLNWKYEDGRWEAESRVVKDAKATGQTRIPGAKYVIDVREHADFITSQTYSELQFDSSFDPCATLQEAKARCERHEEWLQAGAIKQADAPAKRMTRERFRELSKNHQPDQRWYDEPN